MRGACRFDRSLTVANPKGFPREVLLELHPWLTVHAPLTMSAWRLNEFEKGNVFPSQFWRGLGFS